MKLTLKATVLLASQQANLRRTNQAIKKTANLPYIIKKSKILLVLFMLLSIQSEATNGNRGNLLCSIDNKKVSIFINRIYSDAETVCKKYDLPLGLLIAQCCLESGYGTSFYARERCNLLGIKYEGRYAEFESYKKCFEAWARVLSKPKYKEFPCDSLNLWLYNLDYNCYHLAGGRYSRKIKQIYSKYHLDTLDSWK